MKIMTLIPLFKEPIGWIKGTIQNASTYTDDIVVCVNDCFDQDLKDFLESYAIVRKVAFINKDFCQDSIYNSSLLTLAQTMGFYPDWIVKQDIDEEFEPRAAQLRNILETTDYDMLDVLWPSYVEDNNHLCYYTHTEGAVKTSIFRFDLNRLYVPGGLHKNISMRNPKKGLITLNLYHKNLIRSDQENYIKFVASGREIANDGCVVELRNQIPEVLEQGQHQNQVTYIKKEKDAERLLPHSIPKKAIDPNIRPEIIPLNLFNIQRYKDIVKEMYS